MSPLPTLRITDYALWSFSDALGAREPEQGGALLGIRSADVVTTFIHDPTAHATSSLYHNSTQLIRDIDRIETETAARFKGIVHSHPRGMPHPSSQDCREYARSLALNPAMPYYLAMIVTHDLRTPLDPHETAHGPARTSCFGVSARGGEIHLQPLRPVVVPIATAIRRAGLRLSEGDPVLVGIDGVPMICAQVDGDGYSDASLMFSADFPNVAPLVVSYGDEPAAQPLQWDLRCDPRDRLARALEDLRPRRSFQPVPSARRAALSEAAGSDAAPGSATGTVVADRDGEAPLFARTGGILSPTLRQRRVVVVGAGSVGAYVAECLARSGVGAFVLIDPDQVEAENLGRTPYVVADVGQFKVDALARRLVGINTVVTVTRHRETVDGCDQDALVEMVRSADLVVAATDDNRAQQRLNHLAYWTGTPAVFIGLYRGAAGGEVIVSVADGPCWRCSTGNARVERAPAARRVTDYGTGRLIAEPGLLTDIHFVSAAGAKMGLALLNRDLADAGLARFLDEPHERNQSTVIFGMVPRYEYFPQVFAQAWGQYAFQSVWLSALPQPDCPVCGLADQRSDPLAVTHAVPTPAQILAARDRAAEHPGDPAESEVAPQPDEPDRQAGLDLNGAGDAPVDPQPALLEADVAQER